MSRTRCRKVGEREKELIVQMYKAGFSMQEIAEKIGTTDTTIYSWAVKLGLRERRVWPHDGGKKNDKHPEPILDLNEAEERDDATLRAWLKVYWGKWVMPGSKKHPTVSRDGYRIVRKGDKGIRTPYRPDGIFK